MLQFLDNCLYKDVTAFQGFFVEHIVFEELKPETLETSFCGGILPLLISREKNLIQILFQACCQLPFHKCFLVM